MHVTSKLFPFFGCATSKLSDFRQYHQTSDSNHLNTKPVICYIYTKATRCMCNVYVCLNLSHPKWLWLILFDFLGRVYELPASTILKFTLILGIWVKGSFLKKKHQGLFLKILQNHEQHLSKYGVPRYL